MTNDELNSNDRARVGRARFPRQATDISTNPIRQLFVIRASSFLRHLEFVIRH